MDWSWWCTELATTVIESEPITLPCVRLHESYGVCTQVEHDRRTFPTNSQRCNAAVLRKFASSLVKRVRKCIQPDGGHFEKHS